MATDQLMAPLPDVEAQEGLVFKFEAIDPTTGAVVNGVVVSEATLYGDVPDPAPVVTAAPVPPLLGYVPIEDAA